MSYVLLAIGENGKSPYLVRMIVGKNTNSISEISVFDLDAIKAKERKPFYAQGQRGGGQKSFPYLTSTIRIARLFDLVKQENLANEVFSAYVAKKLGVARTNGNLVRIKNRSNQVGERTGRTPMGYGLTASTISISQTAEKSTPSGEKNLETAMRRYSLTIGGEKVSGSIEETRNLVALHNLSEDKLEKVIELGGLPVPSIAITKTDIPFGEYGEITLVFDKEVCI